MLGKHVLAFNAAFLAITFLSIRYYYYSQKKKQRETEDFFEVIMFSERDFELRKSKYSRAMITINMDRILFYISKPKHTLDICMYVLTSPDITNVLLKLRFKNVKIRFIIDSVMAYSAGSSIKRLEKQGIEVRWIKTSNFMHHKFCIVDAEYNPIVLTGSLNWTTQALFGNFENVLVTNNKEVVRNYINEFERLWVLFKPIV